MKTIDIIEVGLAEPLVRLGASEEQVADAWKQPRGADLTALTPGLEGGRYISVTNCFVETGDDAVALGAAGDVCDDLHDVVIYSRTLHSSRGRAIAMYTQSDQKVYGI